MIRREFPVTIAGAVMVIIRGEGEGGGVVKSVTRESRAKRQECLSSRSATGQQASKEPSVF